MKTKRSNAGTPAKVEPQNKPQAEQSAKGAAEQASTDPRVALIYYRDKDGNPDFSRMQDRVKENFRKFYEDDRNRKALGLVAPEPSASVAPASSELFGADEVNVFYDALGFVDALIGAKLYGVPFEMAQEAFTFDEFQRRKLAPHTQRVMNKWAPKIFAQYKDEIGLGVVLFSSVNAHTRKLKKLRRGNAPAATQPEPEKIPDKVRSISEDKPRAPEPRTTPQVGTASDTVDLENGVGFHLG